MNRFAHGAVTAAGIFALLLLSSTIWTSPSAQTEMGLPAIDWITTKEFHGSKTYTVYEWSADANAQDKPAKTTGVLVLECDDPCRPKQAVSRILADSNNEYSDNAQKVDSQRDRIQRLESQLRAIQGVSFVKVESRPYLIHGDGLDADSARDALDKLNDRKTKLTSAINAYDVATQVMKANLEKQWTERLIRQTSEDTARLTIMRARSEQDMRRRLAKAYFDDQQVRMEGLADLDQVRLDYLSALNTLLHDTETTDLIRALETHAVFKVHDESPPVPAKLPTSPVKKKLP